MNWYKISKSTGLQTLKDRNDLNKRIRQFKDIIVLLNKAKVRIPQDANGSRKDVLRIFEDKKITSFPQLQKQLKFVADKMLDNYDTAGDQLQKVIQKLVKYTENMQKDRKEFSFKQYPTKVKLLLNKKDKNVEQE